MYHCLVPFILVVFSSICKGERDNTCNVRPKDQYIERGSSTRVVCQTSCVNGTVFWTLNRQPVDETLSNAVNSTHTVLSLSNFTHHSATLECYSERIKQVLGGTTIRTYSKPGNISCFLDHKNQERFGVPDFLTCSWEHHINPSDQLKINYTVLDDTNSNISPRDICTSAETACTSTNTTTCTDKTVSHTILKKKKIVHVVVKAATTHWEVCSEPREFKPYHILKIIPPKVTVTVLPDHLLVQWNRLLPAEKRFCQVNYSKDSSGDDGNPKTLDPGENMTITIENVESCVNYRVSVRCALDQAPWSNWSREKIVLTKLNKSHIKLLLWRKVGQLETNGVRKVHVMWSDLPSTCEGTFHYSITHTLYEEHLTGGNHTSCGNSTCVIDEDAHRIILTVFHDGVLLAEDSVYVPAIRESPPEVTDIQTSTREGVIVVNWKAPPQPASAYVIDWTNDGNQYSWKESEYTNATLFGLLDKQPYNITVTPVYDDKTGHGTQALQICSRVGDPGNVSINTVRSYDKSAYVSWDTESRDPCSGAVINYTVFYGTQTTPPLNVTVDGKKREAFLKDLIPDTQYSVYVEASALTGSTTSRERLFKTKRFDPRLVTALSASGSAIIVLVLALGLCCAVQWKKFREKPVPNPGLSSVASWLLPSQQKPFSNPSESRCDRVYPEETPGASTTSLATSCNPDCDLTEEYTDSAIVIAPHARDEPVETQSPSSPGESTAFLSSESSSANPYRSQSSVESPVMRSGWQSKRTPVKQPEKTPLKTVYVTLDMFEQKQGR